MASYITPLMTPKIERNFTTVAVPNDIIEQIDNFVARSEHAYCNRSHVVKVALFKFFKNNGNNIQTEIENNKF